MVSVKKLPEPVSDETVQLLEALLEGAKKGKYRGVAVVAIEARYGYIADVTGLAAENPIFTRGALFAIAAKLEHLILEASSN